MAHAIGVLNRATTTRRSVHMAVVALLATLTLVAVPAEAQSRAAVANGRLAYSFGDQFPGSDGQRVHSDVFTVNPDGTGVRQLTHVPASAVAAVPAWSPSGETIAYESNVSGSFQIWEMDGEGNNQRQVTSEATFDHFAPTWSPDGRRIAFSRCDKPFGFDTACDLEVMNADGSEMRRIVGGHRFHVGAAFSPDGRQIVFGSDRDGFQSAIWVVNIDGTGLHRVTRETEEGFAPNWSPDGERLLFSDHCCVPHSNLWSIRTDGTHRRRLTDTRPGHDEIFGSYSPDGKELVFDIAEADPDNCCTDLVVQHADGSRSTVVHGDRDLVIADWGPSPHTATSINSTAPSETSHVATTSTPPTEGEGTPSGATPAGNQARSGDTHDSKGRIAFADFMTGQIETVGPDGSGLRLLTHTDGAHVASWPQWSHDGRRITYSLVARNAPFEARIWVMNADGTGAHQVAGDQPGYRDYQPHLIPNGHTLVFTRCRPDNGVCAIWRMDADGRNRRALTPFRAGADEAVDFGLTVSSDGLHVAFTRFFWRGISSQVFVIDLDGRHEHAVTPAWLEAASPSYSPDGRFLTVTSASQHFGSNIYSLDVNGRDLRRLTTTKYPNNDAESSYSPTGRRIAFSSDRRYHDFCCEDLFAMNRDGSDEHRVPTGGLQGVVQVSWGAGGPVSGPLGPATSGAPLTARRSPAPCEPSLLWPPVDRSHGACSRTSDGHGSRKAS